MQWIDSIHDWRELFWPIDLGLPLGQLLSFLPILDCDKTVFASTIPNPSSIQLSGSPLPSIETEINGKRKPTLYPCMHETKNRVQKVVVEKEALTQFEHKVDLFTLALTAHRIRLARLNRRKNHD